MGTAPDRLGGSAVEGSEQINRVEVTDGLHGCPECGYPRGFHVSFIARQGSDSLSLILVCPGCGSRFDIGRVTCPAATCAEVGPRRRNGCRSGRRATAKP